MQVGYAGCMHCQNCGAENEGGAKFCANCGTTLEPSAPPPMQPPPPPQYQQPPAYQPPSYQQQNYQQPNYQAPNYQNQGQFGGGNSVAKNIGIGCLIAIAIFFFVGLSCTRACFGLRRAHIIRRY